MTEAAVGKGNAVKKGPGKLRALLARRTRDEHAVKTVATGYKPFSRKLPPGLIAAGGILSVVGALGAWIRTSQVVSEGLQEEQVGAVMGYDADWGRLMAAIAGVTTISAFVWLRRNLLLKLASVALSIATIVLTAIRLPVLDDQAAGLAFQARTGEIDFISFHAGFGWGAWCLLLGAIALFLGLSAGVLRELDVRKGIAE